MNLYPETKPEYSKDKHMYGIKQVIKYFILSSPLTVICKGKAEAQKRPGGFIHRGVPERNRKNRHIVEQIKEITYQNRMMLIVEA